MKKVAFWTLFLVFFGTMGCSSALLMKSEKRNSSFAENQFFVLDFEQESLTNQSWQKHFFSTFPHDEPTGGNVIYDRKLWVNKEMIRLLPGKGLYLYIKSRGDDREFDSVRLTSKSFYNLTKEVRRILFVFKGQFPSGKGLWPAWWLNGSRVPEWRYANLDSFPTDRDLDKYSGTHFYETASPVNGPDWPAAGELDIIETINGDNVIHNTLHTCPQMCDAVWNENGKRVNCANAKAGDPNAGCSGVPYQLDEPKGTFACLWETTKIRFYYWPANINVRQAGGPLSDLPQPEKWEQKYLKNEVLLFDSDTPCENEKHQEWQCNNCAESNTCNFVNMKMIFNTTLCGKWAGSHFDSTSQASQNCTAYVLGEGKDLINNQFFKIEYIAVSRL